MVLVALVVRDGDVVLAVLVARDGSVLLFPDGGAPPRVAPHYYKSNRYTRSISSSTSCS